MIKTYEQFHELDPYGEEDWDDNVELQKYHDIVSEWGFVTVHEIRKDMDGLSFDFSMDYPHRGILNFTIIEEGGHILLFLTDFWPTEYVELNDPDKNKVWDAITTSAEKIKPVNV